MVKIDGNLNLMLIICAAMEKKSNSEINYRCVGSQISN
jgi:hypothetical protein